MQMQVDLGSNWCSRNPFMKEPILKAKPKPMAAVCSTLSLSSSPITTTAVVVASSRSDSPLEFNILYHLPLQTMAIKEELPKTKSITTSVQSIPTPKVHFPDDDHLVIVFEFDDDLDSKANRSCYWEFFAVDRCRFKERIQQVAEILNPFLSKGHRDQVYSRLYSLHYPVGANSSNPESRGSADSGSSSDKKRHRKRRRRSGKNKHRIRK